MENCNKVNKDINEEIGCLEKFFDTKYVSFVQMPEDKKDEEMRKEQLDYLLKKIIKRMKKIQNKNDMSLLDKVRAGIPMRIKSWMNGMFIVYEEEYSQMFLINIDDSYFMPINDVLLFLNHKDDEWEEYEIPNKVEFTQEVFQYFFDNIYSKLIDSEDTNEVEKSTVLSMKHILERRLKK